MGNVERYIQQLSDAEVSQIVYDVEHPDENEDDSALRRHTLKIMTAFGETEHVAGWMQVVGSTAKKIKSK